VCPSALNNMSFVLPKYHGSQEHKVDPKYRMSIPVAWRPEDGEQLILQKLSKDGIPFIRALSVSAFEDAVNAINNHTSRTVGEIREAIAYLYETILVVTLNAQGKLLIPKDWSNQAGIEAESTVKLVGRGNYFDIFNAADHAKVSEAQAARVSASMADIGVFSS
jgi:DNA-binding transcriptional regulator/RsmH inhibitor MraZ